MNNKNGLLPFVTEKKISNIYTKYNIYTQKNVAEDVN